MDWDTRDEVHTLDSTVGPGWESVGVHVCVCAVWPCTKTEMAESVHTHLRTCTKCSLNAHGMHTLVPFHPVRLVSTSSTTHAVLLH